MLLGAHGFGRAGWGATPPFHENHGRGGGGKRLICLDVYVDPRKTAWLVLVGGTIRNLQALTDKIHPCLEECDSMGRACLRK